MSKQEIYVGSGKKAQNYDIVNISVCLTDLPQEHIFEYNNKKYIKLTVAKRKKPDKYGKTHSVSIDTFRPEKQPGPQYQEPKPASESQRFLDSAMDDLPF